MRKSTKRTTAHIQTKENEAGKDSGSKWMKMNQSPI